MLFDYPGYGLSDGKGSRAEFESARAAIVAEVRQILAKRASKTLIFWGHSFGGPYCASLAALTPQTAAVVMEGSFGNLDAVVEGKAGVFSPFVRADVDPETVNYDVPVLLSTCSAPIIVIATRDDETVPFPVSERLAEELSKSGKTVKFVELSASTHRTIVLDPAFRPKVSDAFQELQIR